MTILEKIGSLTSEIGAEISAYDPATERLFVVSGDTEVQVISLSDPTAPQLVSTISIAELGAGANSIAVQDGLVAVAVEAAPATDPGTVAFFDTDGDFLTAVEVGALPDMVTFTPDGSQVLVANEGEPDEGVDPEGSVSIINVDNFGVTTADFSAFNGSEAALREEGVRIFPDVAVAEDLEPEFIAVAPDGSTAFVVLQENSSFGVVDIDAATVTDIVPLGVKDHSEAGNALDASDEDGGINIENYPVVGLYMPDGIAAYTAEGITYYVTGNEGDARDEDASIGELELDPIAFPNAEELQADENLGRLEVSTIDGDLDGDGDFDQLFAYGARSFSIWDEEGNLVFDSGDDFEQITAEQIPDIFNSDDEGIPEETFDERSDNKGPEPEGVTVGEISDRTYAFIGLERVGGVMVYEVTNPETPQFVQYLPNPEGDQSPEGLTFISAEASPTEEPLLVVTNEISSTVSVFAVEPGVRISEIQGAGQSSPLEGEAVTDVPGIVTAVDSNGFYFQDPNPDDNVATSEGLFVFTGSEPTVSVGDEVSVSGTVSEFIPGGADTGNLSITQISGDPDVTVLSSDNSLPDPVILGTDGRVPPNRVIDNDQDTLYNVLEGEGDFEPGEDGLDFYETVEGMRVTVQEARAVSGTNRFGEIFTVANNGDSATGLSDRGTINIGPNDFNPERIQVDDDSTVSPQDTPLVDVGAELGDVTGVVSYSFGNFEILATEEFEPTPSDLEPETTNIEGNGELTVASYNVLNLDPVIEDPALTEDGEDDVDDDVGEGRFATIAEQIVDNLATPDIVALQEIQDNNGAEITDVVAADETLQLLVDEIAAISDINYEFIDNPFIGNETSGGQPGGNIRTAYLYNPERVDFVEGSLDPVTDPEDQQTNPDNPFFDSRLPLAATFEFDGEEITLVNNHFSSKGGSSPLFGQLQPATELQENPEINGSLDERRDQAQAVKDFVDDILAADPGANVSVLGDLNEFEFISPLETLEESLNNLTETLPPNERYTFIFQGNSQSLDHILVSDSLFPSADFDIVHVNVEFAETPQTASDHEPLLARLDLGAGAVPGTAADDVLVGTEADETLLAGSGDDLVAGGLGNDQIFGSDRDDVLRGDLNSRDPQVGIGGDDTIFGGAGNDRLGGKGGDDDLFGDAGDDTLFGDDGDDLLRGGAGDDRLQGDDFSGGEGSDTFVLAPGEGTDTVVDFEVGIDSLGLAEGLGFDQVAISQNGSGAAIAFNNETLAILAGISADALTEADFTVI
ncbi:MAG: choice-of-anchor I family protein [Cyanophyceae cyanobacterium]